MLLSIQYGKDVDQLPFSKSKYNRLLCLERHLRKASSGTVSVGQYQRLLEKAAIAVPSVRTLHEDLRTISALSDDLQYGHHRKAMIIDSTASRDAISWFMGAASITSPLAPRMLSSSIRVILSAIQTGARVSLNYEAYYDRNPEWQGQQQRTGFPIKTFSGADTGYVLFFDDSTQKLVTLNLSRIRAPVKRLNVPTKGEQLLYSKSCEQSLTERTCIEIETESTKILRFAFQQFPNLVKLSNSSAKLEVESYRAQIVIDMIDAYFHRLTLRTERLRTVNNHAVRITHSAVDRET